LQISTENLENRQVRLVIEVDEERAQQAMRRAVRQIARQVNIPGFRKGKAPYEVIVQRYGEDTVRREAAELLVETVYGEALKQEEIVPYAPGTLEELELDPISFEFAVPLPPVVQLGDYRDYRLKSKTVRVYKKQVKEELEELREQNAILELVERPAEMEDGVVIDLLAQTAEGAEILNVEELRLLLNTESSFPAPDFHEAIVGMEAGEERTFTLTLSDDFPREELQGQEAEFSVKMREVYDSTLPDLDDDLARTVGNFDSLEDLEDHIKEQIRQAAQESADEEYAAQVLEAVLDQAQVEYPPLMLKETVDEMVEEIERGVKREQHLSLEDYLRFRDQTMEQLREQLEPRAAARLKRALVLGEVVSQENLAVAEEEIGAHIETISATWGVRSDDVRASLRSEDGQREVRSHLLANKAVQRLVAIAKGEAPELAATGEATGEEGEEADGQEAGSEEA
jgi:trigger factor